MWTVVKRIVAVGYQHRTLRVTFDSPEMGRKWRTAMRTLVMDVVRWISTSHIRCSGYAVSEASDLRRQSSVFDT